MSCSTGGKNYKFGDRFFVAAIQADDGGSIHAALRTHLTSRSPGDNFVLLARPELGGSHSLNMEAYHKLASLIKLVY